MNDWVHVTWEEASRILAKRPDLEFSHKVFGVELSHIAFLQERGEG